MMMLASSNGTASNGVISRETAIQGQAAGDKETDRDGENDLILSGLSGSAWLAASDARNLSGRRTTKYFCFLLPQLMIHFVLSCFLHGIAEFSVRATMGSKYAVGRR